MKKRFLMLAALGASGAAIATRHRRSARDAAQASRGADVGFMYAMHGAMRRDIGRLQSASTRVSTGDQLPEKVAEGWDLLRRQLEFHHQAEDDDLWPPLRQRVHDPDQLAEIAAMTREHAAISPAIDAVEAALAGRRALGPPVTEFASVVLDHLDHEERSVLPLVERYLTDADWHEFLHAERGKRPPRERVEFLGWVLDGAEPDHAAAVLTELPAPGRFVYRHVIKRRYDARRLWSTDGARRGEAAVPAARRAS